jgi:hypothetical protein
MKSKSYMNPNLINCRDYIEAVDLFLTIRHDAFVDAINDSFPDLHDRQEKVHSMAETRLQLLISVADPAKIREMVDEIASDLAEGHDENCDHHAVKKPKVN